MKRIVAMLVLIAAGVTVFAQPSDWYVGKTIKNIRFDGLVLVEPKEVEPIIAEFKGKVFDDQLWASILARVYELDYFDTITPEAVPSDATNSTVIIVFKVTEKPAVAGVFVVGNSGLRTTEIIDSLTVKTRTIFNGSKLRLDEIALRRLYQSKGFPDAKVSATSVARADGSIDVTITVDEGVQNIVEKIQFEGVTAVSASALKGELTIKEKGLFQAGQFSETKLDESRQKIEAFYKKRGYVDARVADVRRDATPSGKGGAMRLTLTFVIEEGRQYTFGGMSFTGNTLYTTEQLSAQIKLQPGAILNYERLMQDQARASDLYFADGYIFNGFKLVESRDELNGSIAYTMQIEERPQAHIEDVIFKGNTKTKEFVLKRLVSLEPGDIFSKTKVLESLKNLYNTQFFSSIVPSYEQGSKDMSVDLIVSVEEQSTASIQFGLTYTPSATAGSFPITGLVNWSDINFLGNGQTVALKTNLALDSQDMTFSFSDDWLFGKRWSGAIDFSFKHAALRAPQLAGGVSYDDPLPYPYPYGSYDAYVAAGKVVPDEYLMKYDTWTFSLGYSSGYRFNTPFGTLGLIPGMLHELGMKTYDSSIYQPLDSTIADNLDKFLISNTLYGRVYLNNLNLWYDPSSGYYASQKLGLTGWFDGEINHFLRSDTRLDGFVTLFNVPVTDSWSFKGVLGAHTKFSTLFKEPWRTELVASDSKKLAIDGTFVGRGWAELASTYGTTLWDNWIEYRMPLVTNVLALDGFLSAALLGTSDGFLNINDYVAGTPSYNSGMSLENFAYSAGFGLRFLILQFPFRIYFAKLFAFDNNSGFKSASTDWKFVLSVTTNLD
jgi:outer membrane protein insertion porin family